jgi:hypothetical protein
MFYKVIAALVLLSLQTLADGKINNFNISGSTVELTIQTTPGEYYQVQCCFDLVDGEWIDLGDLFLAEASSTNLAYAVTAPSCYYRAIEKESPPDPETIPPPPPPPPPPPN